MTALTDKPIPAQPDAQTVTAVTHWTDRLFSFRVTRPHALRFRSGEFVMIGLMGDPDPKTGRAKPILRAYSIASPAWDDELEFYSIKVPGGPLTSRLQHVRRGRRDHPAPEARRHARPRRAAARAAAVVLLHGHGLRALRLAAARARDLGGL